MNNSTKIVGMLVMAGTVAGAAGAADSEKVAVASLSSVNGKVLVHGGKNYTLAQPGAALAAGDRIVTLRDGRADVAFANDCVVRVHENSVLPIENTDLCADIEPVKYAEAIGTTRTDIAQLEAAAVVGGGAVAASAGAGAGAAGLSNVAGAALGLGSVAAAGAVDTALHDDRERPISGE